MTLERPLLLIALAALPVLWLLSRRLRQRRNVPVSGLLIWRRLALPAEPPRETRRRSDRLLLLRLAAAAAIGLGLAGPLLRGETSPPALPVLVDASPSMEAFAPEVEAALDAIRAAAPSGARLEVRRSPGLDDLTSVLADGTGDVVVVTDHDPGGLPDGGRVRLFLVGSPVANVGIVSAWLEEVDGGRRYGAVVASFAADRVERTFAGPDGFRALSLAPGERRTVSGMAGEGAAELVLSPGDAFAFDDRIVLEPRPAVRPAFRWRGPDEPRLRIALEVGGVDIDRGAGPAVAYRTTPDADTRLVVAAPGPARPARVGGAVGAGDLPAEAVPDPSVALGPIGPVGTGTPLLLDAAGPIATYEPGRIVVGPDPGDPGCAWPRDPSFPIFFAFVARELGARPPGAELVRGVLDPAESATRPVARRPDLGGLAAARPEARARGTSLSPGLYALAALLLLLHALLEPPAPRRVL